MGNPKPGHWPLYYYAKGGPFCQVGPAPPQHDPPRAGYAWGMRFHRLFLALLLPLALAAATPNPEQVFRGRLEVGSQSLPVRMNLKTLGGKAAGSYVYEKIGKPLRLGGRLEQGRLKLREYAGGQLTGSFDVRMGEGSLEGTWTSPDGKRKGKVSLTRQDHRFAQARLTTRVIADAKSGLEVLYPQFGGVEKAAGWRRVNQALAQEPTRLARQYRQDYAEALDRFRKGEIERWQLEMGALELDYRLLLGTDRLLSVVMTGYGCGPGGCAHPSGFVQAYTLEPPTGNRVALSQLFKKGSNYLARLRELGVEIATSTYDASAREAIEQNLDPRYLQWALSPKGLHVYWSVPHVLGDYIETVIPLSRLEDVLEAGGPIGVLREGR